MRLIRFLMFGVVLAMAGCAGAPDREAVLAELNPAPMDARGWSHATGAFTGPIRGTTERYGFEGLSEMEVRLDLTGPVDDPGAVLKIDHEYSTSWTTYAEKRRTFTNVPSRRYGSQGTMQVTTHAPNQVLLSVRRDGALQRHPDWMVLTFRNDGAVDVDWIGHSGWRGDGELWRMTTPPVAP
jgi:hypothetical protein